MKIKLLISMAAVLVAALVFVGCNKATQEPTTTTTTTTEPTTEYVVAAIG